MEDDNAIDIDDIYQQSGKNYNKDNYYGEHSNQNQSNLDLSSFPSSVTRNPDDPKTLPNSEIRNLNANNEVPEEIKEVFLDIPENTKPIEYVDSVEKNYPKLYTNQVISNFDNINERKKRQRERNYMKYSLFEISKKSSIKTNVPTDNTHHNYLSKSGDNLYISVDDLTTMYQFEKELPYKKLQYEGKNKDKKSVTAIHSKEDYVVIGYSSKDKGEISLWSKSNNEPINSHVVHKGCILGLLLFNIDKAKDQNVYEVLSSDSKGTVNYNKYSPGFGGSYKISTKRIFENVEGKYPVHGLESICHQGTFYFLFIKQDLVHLYTKEGEQFKEIDRFKSDEQNPQSNNNMYTLNDASFGYGYLPVEKTFQKNKYGLIIAISWGNYVNLYFKGDNDKFQIAGNFFEEPRGDIMRIGFISPSSLLIFVDDESPNIIMVNTRYFNFGSIEKTKEKKSKPSSIPRVDNVKVEEEKLYKNKINADAFTIKMDGKDIPIYRSVICFNDLESVIICKKEILYCKIHSFETYINALRKSGLWLEAMYLGLDIFKQQLTVLPGIPLNPETNLVDYLKKLVENYVDENIKSIQNGADIQNNIVAKNNYQLESIMKISIDFCLNLNNPEYLFGHIFKEFSKVGYGNFFVKKLEPFIFSSRLQGMDIKKEDIIELIKIYIDNKECQILSHLLTYLDEDKINTPEILPYCKDYNLFRVFIHIYNNQLVPVNPNDILNLIEDMFNLFNKSENANEDISNNYFNYSNKFISYQNHLTQQDIVYFENTKEYLGHQLMWYINGLLLNYQKHEKLIQKLFVWILSTKVFMTFIKFDSFSYMTLLKRFYINEAILKLLADTDFNTNEIKEFIDKYNLVAIRNKKPDLDYSNIKETINYLHETASTITSFYIIQDISSLIITLAIKTTGLVSNNVIFDAFKSILNFENLLKDYQIEADLFKCHRVKEETENLNRKGEIVVEQKYLNELGIKLINFLENSKIKFTQEENEELANECKNSKFHFVTIKLLEQAHEYDKCIEVYLDNIDTIGEPELFKWISSTLKNLKNDIDDIISDSDKIFKNLKNKVLRILPRLSPKSFKDTIKLLDEWYEPTIKIDLMKDLNGSDKEKLGEINNMLDKYLIHRKIGDSEALLDDEYIGKLLYMQLEYLIKLKKTKDIIGIIMPYKLYYPIEESLTLCINNELTDAVIIFNVLLTKFQEALSISMGKMDNAFYEAIRENNLEESANENMNDNKELSENDKAKQEQIKKIFSDVKEELSMPKELKRKIKKQKLKEKEKEKKKIDENTKGIKPNQNNILIETKKNPNGKAEDRFGNVFGRSKTLNPGFHSNFGVERKNTYSVKDDPIKEEEEDKNIDSDYFEYEEDIENDDISPLQKQLIIFKKYFQISEKVCVKSSDNVIQQTRFYSEKSVSDLGRKILIRKENESQIWFVFLDKIYQYLSYTEENGQKLKEIISILLEDLLQKMCFFVKLDDVLEHLEYNVDFKEFKSITLKAVSNYRLFNLIYNSGRGLMRESVLDHMKTFVHQNVKGNKYKPDTCDYCKRAFRNEDENEKIVGFRCGHKYDGVCAERLMGYIDKASFNGQCYICKMTELEEDYRKNMKEDTEEEMNEEKLEQLKEMKQRYEEETKEKAKSKFFARNMPKIKALDKKLEYLYSMYDVNLDN